MLIRAGEWQALESIEKSNLLIQAYQESHRKRISRYEREFLDKKRSRLSHEGSRLIKRKY